MGRASLGQRSGTLRGGTFSTGRASHGLVLGRAGVHCGENVGEGRRAVANWVSAVFESYCCCGTLRDGSCSAGRASHGLGCGTLRDGTFSAGRASQGQGLLGDRQRAGLVCLSNGLSLLPVVGFYFQMLLRREEVGGMLLDDGWGSGDCGLGYCIR